MLAEVLEQATPERQNVKTVFRSFLNSVQHILCSTLLVMLRKTTAFLHKGIFVPRGSATSQNSGIFTINSLTFHVCKSQATIFQHQLSRARAEKQNPTSLTLDVKIFYHFRAVRLWRSVRTEYPFSNALLQNHRMVGVGRDLCGSPSPTPC